MVSAREIHGHILARIELALRGRSWSWLARETGVPHSTLASQKAKPKFSVEVLVLVADALERDVAYFLPLPEHGRSDVTDDVLAQIRDLLDKVDEPS